MTPFNLPRNNQASSILMRLPAELRTMILRRLLKQATPLDKITPLSSQILQTCQNIYKEAYPILYTQNTLLIYCHDHFTQARNLINILDISLPSQVGREDIIAAYTLQEDAAEALGWWEEDGSEELQAHPGNEADVGSPHASHVPGRYGALLKLGERYAMLDRFRRIELRIEYEIFETLVCMCRVLRELLAGKQVTLVAVPRTQVAIDAGFAWLQSAAILRCSSMSIRAVGIDVPSDMLDTLVQTTTGQTPAVDTYEMFVDVVFRVSLAVKGDDFYDEVDKEAFGKAALTYDVERYEEEKKLYLEAVRVWSRNWWAERRRELEQEERRVMGTLEEIGT